MNEVEVINEERFMGEMPFLLKSTHSQSYVASRRSSLYKLERAHFDKLVNGVRYIFSQISFFAKVESRYYLELLPLCSIIELDKNAVAMGEECKLPPGGFYYIVKGLLKVNKTNALLKENMYFGHEALLGFECESAKIIASEPTVILFISKEAFSHRGFDTVRDDLEDMLSQNSEEYNGDQDAAASGGPEERTRKRLRKWRSKVVTSSKPNSLKLQTANSDAKDTTSKAAYSFAGVIPNISLW